METGDAILDERRARRQREQLGEDVAERVADCDRAVGAADADVHVQPEAVVAPDDVLEDVVVTPVMGRVDDPLVLPAAPWMRSRAGKPDAEAIGKIGQLRAPLAHPFRDLREVRAASRLDLDFGRDQLADEVLVDVGSLRAGLQLLEPVRELEGLGVDQSELLLDCDREVLPVLERVPREADLLVGAQALSVTHVASVFEVMPG